MPIDPKLDALSSVSDRLRTAQRLATLESQNAQQSNKTFKMALPAVTASLSTGAINIPGPYIDIGNGSIVEWVFRGLVTYQANTLFSVSAIIGGSVFFASALNVSTSASGAAGPVAVTTGLVPGFTLAGAPITVVNGMVTAGGPAVSIFAQYTGPSGLQSTSIQIQNSAASGNSITMAAGAWSLLSVRS